MKRTRILKIVLGICTLPVILAGLFALLSPIDFAAKNGIDINENISLLNDYRSFGGLLLGSGLLISSGVFKSNMIFYSLVSATIIYFCFSSGRILSIFMDGYPAEGLVRATIVEFILGLLAFLTLLKYRKQLSSNM